jgi:hypothetical protein
MPSNPFDSPKEIEARAKAAYGRKSGGLLDGLTKKAPEKFDTRKNLQKNGQGFLMTKEDHELARKGGTPSGFSRDKDGNLRAMVQ